MDVKNVMSILKVPQLIMEVLIRFYVRKISSSAGDRSIHMKNWEIWEVLWKGLVSGKMGVKKDKSMYEGFSTHYVGPHKYFWEKNFKCSGRQIHRLTHEKSDNLGGSSKRACKCGNVR